ncbi:MAG: class I SAM-dependent methyltransferase, partial [Candidatus Bathyarchaeota archaeon]|nr:class I SAM-dependent methyltransferase [Candidatus Bathyarchaeum sp.]
LSYCHQNYKAVSPLMSSGIKLPFKDNSFDLVVSFQVIEHIAPKEVVTYLHEIKRVLRPDGTFTVTTPNKLLRLLPFQKPWSSGHKKEYDAKELETLLANVFGNVKIFGLFATKDAYLTEYKRVKQSPLHVYFFNPLGLMMSKVLSKSLMAKLKIVVHAKETNSSNQYSTIANFKLDDFQLSQENLNNSLDLYGICTNTGAIES